MTKASRLLEQLRDLYEQDPTESYTPVLAQHGYQKSGQQDASGNTTYQNPDTQASVTVHGAGGWSAPGGYHGDDPVSLGQYLSKAGPGS